jgi:phosphoribosyl-ATP pyrophosphohydrolase/phosphoribosyl-AMP cyclohydrolase
MDIKWDERGLAPVVAQDVQSGRVLMLAWANGEALRLTLASGEAHYWSRSRQEIWLKGATSGNRQRVQAVFLDCDGDSLLYQVVPAGPACHSGATSCFFTSLEVNSTVDDSDGGGQATAGSPG